MFISVQAYKIFQTLAPHRSSQNEPIPLGLSLLLTCAGVAGILAYGHTQALHLSFFSSISVSGQQHEVETQRKTRGASNMKHNHAGQAQG